MEQQTDETIQSMAPLDPEAPSGEDEGVMVTIGEDDEVTVEIVGEEEPEPVAKEVLEDDDPSIEDIEQELSEEQLKKLNLTKGVRGRLDKLTWQKNEERRQREAAEAQAAEAVRYAQSVQNRLNEMEQVMARGEQVLVSEVRSRTKADLAAAEQAFEAAAAEGDPKRMLEAQKALNKAQVESMEADRHQPVMKPDAPQGQQATPQNPTPQPQQFQPQGDPASDPKLVAWMDANKWFKTDPVKTAEAMVIHRELTEIRGVNPMTDEYYSQLDSRLAQRFPDLSKESTEKPSSSTQQADGSGEPAAPAAPTVVAPPSEATGPGVKNHQSKSRTVQLSPAQVRLAETLGITKEQYAKQLLKEQSNG